MFISSFSEPLYINIEGLNSLLLGVQLFIQIYFDRVCGSCAHSHTEATLYEAFEEMEVILVNNCAWNQWCLLPCSWRGISGSAQRGAIMICLLKTP